MLNKNSLFSMLPLFLVLFIDGMGLGLLFPILNGVIVDPASDFLFHTVSTGTREIIYGLIVGIFMICWFFGAAILGDLSDTIGRKKALMICLIGSFIGYLLSAISIMMHSLTLLILGRVIAGFTAGSQPVAQAAIVDVSSEEHKTRNIGFILLSVSLGFVCGPIIGGVLSDSQIYSGFNYDTPLYFASIISLINAVLLGFFFKETFYKTEKIKIKLHHAVSIFISAFGHKKICKLAIVMLVMIFGWSNYFSFISVYMTKNYHFNTFENSMFLAVMGVGFSIGCGYVVEWCAKRYLLSHTVRIMLILTGISVLLTLLIHNVYTCYLFALLIGLTLAVAYSSIIALFSNQVGADEQGWVMGVTGSIMALCFGLTSFGTGVVASFAGASIPIVFAVIGLLASGGLLYLFRFEEAK
ncbi:Tetracycline resistance protein, class C [Piscirickettsia salmonis]|uniref:MFS transporter n=1 Tax=Piscirickettsia salmonis TaxID=1238 RepID=UPI0012B7154B|nr:MFS transporter [Piscirickettsia salmonis]QGP49216.1 Tetracycline resistance protein, class C [Piscirickettsia salmonis]